MLAMIVLGSCGCLSLGDTPSVMPSAVTPRGQKVEMAMVAIRSPSQTDSAPAVPSAAPVERNARFADVTTPASVSGRMVVIGPPATERGNEVRRSADGLFYVNAIVNGAPVRFLVDTGATVIVLTPEDARRAGVSVESSDFSASAETANGRTSMARVTLDEIVVGATRTRALGAAVVQGNLPVSLLGQNWLAQLSSITISGDRMLLN